MTNLPKKLGNPPTPPETEFEMGMIILVNKINEILDYLQEEASKGECKCGYQTQANVCSVHNLPESKGECLCSPKDRYADQKCPVHGVKQDPLQHEESKEECKHSKSLSCDKCVINDSKSQLKEESPKEDEEE